MSLRARREREETARPRCRRSMSLSFSPFLSLSLSLSIRWSPVLIDAPVSPFLSLIRRASVSPLATAEDGRRRKPLLAARVADSICPLLRFATSFRHETDMPIIDLPVDLDLGRRESTADTLPRLSQFCLSPRDELITRISTNFRCSFYI